MSPVAFCGLPTTAGKSRSNLVPTSDRNARSRETMSKEKLNIIFAFHCLHVEERIAEANGGWKRQAQRMVDYFSSENTARLNKNEVELTSWAVQP